MDLIEFTDKGLHCVLGDFYIDPWKPEERAVGIAASNRHKSGEALRFPRISQWRKDKKPDEINSLDDLKKMLELYGGGLTG